MVTSVRGGVGELTLFPFISLQSKIQCLPDGSDISLLLSWQLTVYAAGHSQGCSIILFKGSEHDFFTLDEH